MNVGAIIAATAFGEAAMGAPGLQPACAGNGLKSKKRNVAMRNDGAIVAVLQHVTVAELDGVV